MARNEGAGPTHEVVELGLGQGATIPLGSIAELFAAPVRGTPIGSGHHCGVYERHEATRIPAPPNETELPLHRRAYDVRSYRIDGSTFRLRGRITDTKPPGVYVADDLEPLDVHDMVVDLIIEYPSLTIAEAEVVFETHPHSTCPEIEGAYPALIGESIARGFSRRVTELFGGPSGCTHVGALLRAMAPVAVQSMYSMRMTAPDATRRAPTPEDRRRAQAFTINSCHVWAEDGEWARSVAEGTATEAPVWLERRLRKLDRLDELADWGLD